MSLLNLRPTRIYQSKNHRFSVRENKNTISSGSAFPAAINYKVPGIIRRKPLREY